MASVASILRHPVAENVLNGLISVADCRTAHLKEERVVGSSQHIDS